MSSVKVDRGTWGKVIGWMVLGLFLALVAMLVFAAHDQRTRDDQFDGVCNYLHGQVEGDVCIRDGKVVARKDAS